MSKIVETLVKSDLEGFLTATDALPRSQHGFRSGRSCTTALGNAHSGWLGGVRTGKVVGVIAYDLSVAFDTVAADRLLPKLERIGVKGTALAWFTDYLCGGRQSVVWNSGIGDFVGVRFRVRQGSILGPVLFLLHVADMAEYLGGDAKNSNLVYADDSNVWVIAETWAEVKAGLETVSTRFACWAKGNGLHMNPDKTQVLASANVGKTADLSVKVDGKTIAASETLELLGVRFDRKFTTAPHIEHLAGAVKQRAALISRLTHHLPRGQYLRQLAQGLVFARLATLWQWRLPQD
jgi:hypothetical protein